MAITPRSLRDEQWFLSKHQLLELLDAVPMTRDQRRDIDNQIHSLEVIYNEANNQPIHVPQ